MKLILTSAGDLCGPADALLIPVRSGMSELVALLGLSDGEIAALDPNFGLYGALANWLRQSVSPCSLLPATVRAGWPLAFGSKSLLKVLTAEGPGAVFAAIDRSMHIYIGEHVG